MNFTIPELCLVVLIGPSGSGKSTFARTHFKPTEVLSSDVCRGLVSDDENDQSATKDAFELLHFIAGKRLAAGKLTVIDATSVRPEDRKPLIELARTHHCLPIAIVLNLPERLCIERNQSRPDRDFGPHVVRQQHSLMRRSLRWLDKDGFRSVLVLSSPEEVAAVSIERQPLWTNRKADHGPFDIIGDVHGCFDELVALLKQLGYIGEPLSSHFRSPTPNPWPPISHPDGRKVVFLGDLVDRGPKIPEVLRFVMNMVTSGTALCVPGNHDTKLLRKLRGRNVQISHGLAESLAQLEDEPAEFKEQIVKFLHGLISHYMLDDGKLVVAHAGMKAELQGRASKRVRDFALFGETTGETDEYGLPVRYNWAAEYRGTAIVVYGHTPVPEPEWVNRTINIDTGCVFGGKLTALRYPEREFVSVTAARGYYASAKPFPVAAPTSTIPTVRQEADDLLAIEDVLGKRIINTRLHGSITIREENTIAALEVMSRFAANPRWLIYLPPTMSPSETTVEAYRRYCWPVHSLTDLKLAPFHLLASEGTVHSDKAQVWHMEMLAKVCQTDTEILLATPYKVVDVTDSDSQAAGIAWWEDLTGRGGEGMVVKPFDFITSGRRGLVQPAVKCRGREYLRIIYGPEYTTPEHLERLRVRGLSAKRSLALREFALGIEALERFVRQEPFYRVHECVFGTLALESEPVDPRL